MTLHALPYAFKVAIFGTSSFKISQTEQGASEGGDEGEAGEAEEAGERKTNKLGLRVVFDPRSSYLLFL